MKRSQADQLILERLDEGFHSPVLTKSDSVHNLDSMLNQEMIGQPRPSWRTSNTYPSLSKHPANDFVGNGSPSPYLVFRRQNIKHVYKTISYQKFPDKSRTSDTSYYDVPNRQAGFLRGIDTHKMREVRGDRPVPFNKSKDVVGIGLHLTSDSLHPTSIHKDIHAVKSLAEKHGLKWWVSVEPSSEASHRGRLKNFVKNGGAQLGISDFHKRVREMPGSLWRDSGQYQKKSDRFYKTKGVRYPGVDV